jgi:hypothetical protein
MRKKSRDSLINTARSLQSMAQRGDAHERENAEYKLARFVRQHGITAEELGHGHVRRVRFTVPEAWHWLFTQMALNVLGPVDVRIIDANTMTVPCAPEDVPTVWAKYQRYQRLYEEQEALFRIAFMEANALWMKPQPLHRPPARERHREEASGHAVNTPPPAPTEEEGQPYTPPPPPPQEPGADHGLLRNMRVKWFKEAIRTVPFHIPIGDGDPIPAETTDDIL